MRKINLINLDFVIGRISLDGTDDSSISLDIVRPSIDGQETYIPASSICIIGKENLTVLRDAITQVLDDFEEQKKEEKEKYPGCPF